MVLKYVISPYPALKEPMVVRIWEAQSDGPLGWVYEQVIPEKNGAGVPTVGAGHNVPNIITANGLDLVPHIVRLYTQSGSLLHEYTAEPKADTVTVFDPINFKIGDGGANTPAIGTTTYHNDNLVGLGPNDYIIFRKFVGQLTDGIDVNYLQDVDNHYIGSWSLIAPDQFGDAEEFLMILLPKAATNVVNDSVVGKWFAGIVDVNATRDYLPTDLRKLIRLNGTVNYNFPVGAATPIGYGFIMNHFGNNAADAVVNFNNAPLRWINGTTQASFNLAQSSEAFFVYDGTLWNLVYYNKVVDNVLPGKILGVGRFAIGNAPVGDLLYQVNHNLDIDGDYLVFLSCESTSATAGKDDDWQSAWYHNSNAANKRNMFFMEIGIPAGSVGHNITVCYLIVKI